MTDKLPSAGKETIRRLAIGFTLFVLIFETYAVGVNTSDAFVDLFNSGSRFMLFAALALVVATLYLTYRFFLAAFSSDSKYRGVYLVIFTASLAIEYSYQKALGRFSEVLDIELALATTFEQKTESIAMYFGFLAIVPAVLFAILLVLTFRTRDHGFRDLIGINAALVGVLFAGSVLGITQFPTVSAIAFYRTNVEFALSGPIAQGGMANLVTGDGQRRQAVLSPDLPDGYSPENNIILVIDESVRGDHFSLNGYGRPTTPILDELHAKGILHNWGIAAAASTGSHTSYNSIVTGMTPDDFPDPGQKKLKTTPTVFQYAKAMGYTTWFFDGQMDFFWSGIRDDRRYVDNWLGINTIKGTAVTEDWEIDIEIARRLRKITSGSKGNFILVFKHGSHVPYHRNFPPDRAVWQPSYANEDRFAIPGMDKLEAVANAYDNSILFSVNTFFENLFEDYSRIPNNTVVVYTGDHGQTLFANGRASHSGHSRAEATVPLLMIGSLAPSIDTAFKASHHNIYPTLLDLMNYPEGLRAPGRALSLLTAKKDDTRPRYFNPSYGAKLPFDY